MSVATLRALGPVDAPEVLTLYRAAAAGRGGLARRPDEIDLGYVQAFLTRASAGGVSLGAYVGEALAGEIHATRIGPRQFAHVLTDLTVAVHPDHQGQGLGQALFKGLFAAAVSLTPPAERIELMARDGNADAIRLYERLGFVIEGRFPGRVRLEDGTVEADIAMGRPLP